MFLLSVITGNVGCTTPNWTNLFDGFDMEGFHLHKCDRSTRNKVKSNLTLKLTQEEVFHYLYYSLIFNDAIPKVVL